MTDSDTDARSMTKFGQINIQHQLYWDVAFLYSIESFFVSCALFSKLNWAVFLVSGAMYVYTIYCARTQLIINLLSHRRSNSNQFHSMQTKTLPITSRKTFGFHYIKLFPVKNSMHTTSHIICSCVRLQNCNGWCQRAETEIEEF